MSDALDDKITVKVDGADREVEMSYGLLTLCTRLIKNDNDLGGGNPEVRDALLEAALTKRNGAGKAAEDFKLAEHALTVADATRVFAWVQGHLIDFLSQTARGLGEAAKRVQAMAAQT